MNDFHHHSQPHGHLSHADALIFLEKRVSIIIIFAVAGVLISIFYAASLQPQFTAQTQILIVPRGSQTLEDKGDGADTAIDPARVEGQLAILQSETIAQDVIQKHNLADDPEFQASGPSLLSRLKTGLSSIFSGNTKPQGAKPEEEFVRSRVAIAIFQNKLSVRRVGTSYAISIAFTSREPEKAARIANAVAESYIQDQIATAAETARNYSVWLEGRIDEARKQLNEAARAVQLFRAGQTIRGPLAGRFEGTPETAAPNGGAPQNSAPQSNPSPQPPGLAEQGHPITLAELEARSQHYQKIYETYLEAFTNSLNRQSLQLADARIITRATRPLVKSSPRTTLIAALGGAIGLLVGIGIALIRHNLENSVQSARQIREKIGVACLAEVPRLGKWGRFDQRLRAVRIAPFSGFTGALKLLKNAIVAGNGKARSIGVTSVLPGEGKTTVAANLATLIANSGERVLLIDTDMHQATISKSLAPGAETGILEVLTGIETLRGAIIKSAENGADILPYVSKHYMRYAYEIFSSKAMIDLLNELRKSYDRIIVDMPPLGPVVDGVEISAQLDGVVIAAEWGRTSVTSVEEAVRALRSAKARILGVVITKIDPILDQSWKKDWSEYYGNKDESKAHYKIG